MNSNVCARPRAVRRVLAGLVAGGALTVGLISPASAAVGTNAVDGPAAIYLGNVDGVIITGTAQADVTIVTVGLDDGQGNTVELIPTVLTNSATGQTWRTDPVDANGLADSDPAHRLHILSSFDAGSNPADSIVDKDTVEPAAPQATPGSATFTTADHAVTITAADPADQARTHYNIDSPGDPTVSDPVVPASLPIGHTMQVKAVTFDLAGNPSLITTRDYVVNLPVVPPNVPPVVLPTGTGTGTGTPAGPPIVVPPPVLPPGMVHPAVPAAVTGTLNRRAVHVGTRVTFTGTVTPYKGVTLSLQRRLGNGPWTRLATKMIPTTARSGAYTFTVPTARSGAASYRVTATGPGVLPSASTTRRLTVYRATVAKVTAAGAENVSVRNTGTVTLNLAGWKLKDASGTTLALPAHQLKAGATVKVYTGTGAKAAGKLFLAKRTGVWNTHDTAKLYDPNNMKVASLRY